MISAVSATLFGDFSGCFAGFRELFCGFQQFQLLFSGIFPAFGLDWGAVLEVLWITATQKTVSGEADYTVTCSSEFVPYDFPQ